MKLTLTERRKQFAKSAARDLASQAAGVRAEAFTEADRGLTTKSHWFVASGRLIVVAGPYVDPRDVDLALTYGLYHARKRNSDLVLVIPKDDEASRPTVARAPWIGNVPELWTYDLEGIEAGHRVRATKQVIATRAEVLKRYRDPNGWNYGTEASLRPKDHEEFLGQKAAWVERITGWAEVDPDLDPAHTGNYLAWHCQGTIVLKIVSSKSGLSLTSGIHHREVAKRPEKVDITGPLTGEQEHRLIGKAALAAAQLLGGDGGGYREHRLQAVIAKKEPNVLGLKHNQLRREHPAWRPYPRPKGRGFIDFLGTDGKNRLHVVETKIGADEMLVLQGLDYWIWTMANRTYVAGLFELPVSNPEVCIDFVVSKTTDGKPAFGPYSGVQAQSLAAVVKYQFVEISNWEGSDRPTVKKLDLGHS